MKISSGWRICYCNTRGLTSRCQRGDIRGAGQELGLCISRRGGKQAFSSGLPAGLEAASWHITQAPEAGRVLAAASGPPSRSPGRFHHENKGTFWDNKQTCEFCREQKKTRFVPSKQWKMQIAFILQHPFLVFSAHSQKGQTYRP